MKNKLWIVFLALSVAFACAAGYLFISYQNQGTATEQAMEDLRSIRDASKAAAGESKSEETTSTQPMPMSEMISAPEDEEPEVMETQIPVDYTGFDDVTEEDDAIVSGVPTKPAPQQFGMTLSQQAQAESADGAIEEIAERAIEPETEETTPEAIKPSKTPMPFSVDEIPIEDLVLPSATAVEEISYSLNTVVPRNSAEAMPTNWVSKPKYTLKEEDILPEYKELYEINDELIGWLTIEGTKIDYPVVQTDNPDFYLNHDFYKKNNYNGMLIVTPEYDVLTPGQNILIHGHNMRNGKMFNNLQNYASESFFKNHQYIKFDTLTEHREYQVVSAFYTRIYKDDEPGFRYNVILGDNVEVTKYFVTGIRQNAAYDTGVYFDRYNEYLVLSTCAYHAREGRFVVAAKRVDQQGY